MNNVVTHWNNRSWESDPAEKMMVHGSAFHGGQLLRGCQLATVFSEADLRPESWQDVLSNCNGFFAIARHTPTVTLVAVDRIRSIPVFYGQQGGTVFVSDDAEWVRQSVGDTEMDPVARAEFQLAGYVTGSDTLYPNVKQLQAGELLHILAGEEPELATHRWYRFTHSEPEHWDEGELRDDLDKSAESSVRRLAEYAAGRQIVIPLSGGYDSRLIALLLKRIGYDNILTFTYGVPGNKESEYSRQVAEALSLPWHFIEYSAKKWRDAWQTEERLEFQRWGSGWSSLPHVQDWLAVRELKCRKIIPDDSVIVPGHGAMAILSHFKALSDDHVLGDIQKAIFSSKFNLAPVEPERHRKILDRISDGLAKYNETPIDPWSLFGFYEWQERQSKFLVNAVRVYDFYGYDWWLPLWDAEFMSFWQNVPLELRKGKGWYTEYVQELGLVCRQLANRNASARSTILVWAKKIANEHVVRALFPMWQKLKGKQHVCMPYARFERELVDNLHKRGYRVNGVEAFMFMEMVAKKGC